MQTSSHELLRKAEDILKEDPQNREMLVTKRRLLEVLERLRSTKEKRRCRKREEEAASSSAALRLQF